MKAIGNNFNHISLSEEHTYQIGYQFADRLSPNSVVSLSGELGSGKTVFIRGICGNLCPDVLVSSPSFTIINIYPSNLCQINHVDLYRLNSYDEFYESGIAELFDYDNITLIEWGEKIENMLPENTIKVSLHIIEDKQRKIEIKL